MAVAASHAGLAAALPASAARFGAPAAAGRHEEVTFLLLGFFFS